MLSRLGTTSTVLLVGLFTAACSSNGKADGSTAQDAASSDVSTSNQDAQGMDAPGPTDMGLLDEGSADTGAGVDAGASLDAGPGDAMTPDGMIMCPDGGSGGFCTGLRIALLGTAGLNPSSNFQAWLRSQGQQVGRYQVTTQTSSTSSVTAAFLGNFDVVILDQLVRSYSSDEANALRDWVAGGGGVMSMSGYTGSGADYQRPNTLLASIGIQYLPGLLNGPVTIFASHPVTQGLTSVTFNGGYHVGLVTGVTGGMNTITATLSAGPIEIVQERVNGRVVVWGDEWVEYDSEWQGMPMIRMFWIDVLNWLIHRH